MKFHELFLRPDLVDAVFFKVVTKNDDSGRHGVLIPKEAYSLFPEFPGFAADPGLNRTLKIETLWKEPEGPRVIESSWKHYQRYPERRVTALRSRRLDSRPPGTIIVFGRRGRDSSQYECHVLYPSDPGYAETLQEFGFTPDKAAPGLFGTLLSWNPARKISRSPALEAFLVKFDEITALGFVATRRTGDTGVGYTFESLMGIAENNQMTGDFEGMEIKTYRSKEMRMQDSEKVNLFLLEPRWTDGMKSADRVRQYGYVDDQGKFALYSAVQIRRNSHGLCFRIDRAGGRLWLDRGGKDVAFWEFSQLDKRLREKHGEAVFVSAESRGRGAEETFRYRNVTYCRTPSAEAYLSLIERGDAMLELRMHVGPTGQVRNHGSGFRVKKNCIPSLYEATVQVRPV